MHLDATTYNDISVFHQEEEFSIFHKLNFTRTVYGKEWLRHFFSEPHHDLKKILGTQKIIRTLKEHLDDWPTEITNGTLLVIEKYLDYNIDPLPQDPNPFTTWTYKTFHLEDYRMVKYSVGHCADFFRGLKNLVDLFSQQELPAFFKIYIERAEQLLREPPLAKISSSGPGERFTPMQSLYFGYHIRNRYKNDTIELLEIFGRLDAWYSMALAMKNFDLHFPEFIELDKPTVNAKGLYHLLLKHPVSYDLEL
ncbi:MAG TPA: DNA mismatch repair protein MutS, partial [Chitinophagaceae bacterium]